MAYFTIGEARRAYEQARQRLRKSADEMLRESLASSLTRTFDIFLSHAYEDKELMIGVKILLEEQGKSVYLDWAVDGHLDRSKVTADTAALLRTRMNQSSSLIFAATKNSPSSKWMPWELGYFDGSKPGRVSVMPLTDTAGQPFDGQEYLSLYPVLKKLQDTMGREGVYVTKSTGYLPFGEFTAGRTQYRAYVN